MKKINAYDFSYFRGKNYFDESGTQNYYILQPLTKYLKVTRVINTKYILSQKSRGLDEAAIESIKTRNYSLNPPHRLLL